MIEQAPEAEDEDEDQDVLAVPAHTKNLEAQSRKLDLSSKIGKRLTVTNEVKEIVVNEYIIITKIKVPKDKQGGFYCKSCDCVLKDSQAYLDHINGRKRKMLLLITKYVNE